MWFHELKRYAYLILVTLLDQREGYAYPILCAKYEYILDSEEEPIEEEPLEEPKEEGLLEESEKEVDSDLLSNARSMPGLAKLDDSYESKVKTK
nr:hypothetical protein [Tanacetum cinerariifolium]